MDYAQARTITSSATQTAPESVGTVLQQALSQFSEVEQRLLQLRDRIEQPGPSPTNIGKAEAMPSGMMSQANLLRNTSARLQSLCGDLERML